MTERGKESKRFGHAKSFADLVVYQKARTLAREVFQLTKRFPKEELHSLTDQWRRAARSIGAQIAEAWGKRRYAKHFISKLTDADAEQQETQHWIITAYDCGYITRDEAHSLGTQTKQIGAMLGAIMKNAEQFSGETIAPMLQEPTASYFCEDQNDTAQPETENRN